MVLVDPDLLELDLQRPAPSDKTVGGLLNTVAARRHGCGSTVSLLGFALLGVAVLRQKLRC
jgi:hypothetical protein